ncbi:MAG: hypothetical protein U5L11_17505 [Arhodomonas sp.]|nr:hypothetical protein [Arhodomonas sp.]
MPLTGGSWRLTLLVWALPALAIAAALALPRSVRASGGERPRWQPDWHDANVWRLGLLLGASSMAFFGTNAYMGSILSARGALEALPMTLLLFNVSQVVASVTMLFVSGRLLARRGPLFANTLATVVGLVVFSLLEGWAALAGALLVGFATAVQLILLVSLPPYIGASAEAGRLSAGMFTLGYAMAFAVPLLGGLVADALSGAVWAMLPITVYVLASMALIPALRLEGSRA